MQNADQLRLRDIDRASRRIGRGIANSEVLVALGQAIEMKPIGRVGEKNLRPHFRINRLAVNVRECEAEDERTQIIDVGNPAEGSKRTFGHETRVLTALVLRRIANAAIHHSLIVEINKRSVARTSPEFS